MRVGRPGPQQQVRSGEGTWPRVSRDELVAGVTELGDSVISGKE